MLTKGRRPKWISFVYLLSHGEKKSHQTRKLDRRKKVEINSFSFFFFIFQALIFSPTGVGYTAWRPTNWGGRLFSMSISGGPGFGTVLQHQYLNPCTLHQEYRRSLPSKNCPGLMFHTFSILMGYIIFKNLAMIALKPHSNSDHFGFSVTDDQVRKWHHVTFRRRKRNPSSLGDLNLDLSLYNILA